MVTIQRAELYIIVCNKDNYVVNLDRTLYKCVILCKRLLPGERQSSPSFPKGLLRVQLAISASFQLCLEKALCANKACTCLGFEEQGMPSLSKSKFLSETLMSNCGNAAKLFSDRAHAALYAASRPHYPP